MIAIARRGLFGMSLFRNRSRATRVIRQTGKAFCLDAAIQMLCAHFNMKVPSGSEIRRLAGTSANGASMLGAKHCLEQIGFDVQAGQGTFEQLRSINRPAIAIVTNKDGSLHYVVINRAAGYCIEVLNPSGGFRTTYDDVQFDKIWTGIVLLATPAQNPNTTLQTESNPFSFIAKTVNGQKSNILLACVAGVFQTALVLASLVLLRKLVHSLTYETSSVEMVGYIVGFLLCAVFKVLFFSCSDQIKNLIQKQVALNLEIQSAEHVQQMTSESLLRSDSLELAQRSRNDAGEIGTGMTAIAESAVQVFVVISLLIIVAQLDPYRVVFLTILAASILIPIAAYFPNRKDSRLKQMANEANEVARKHLAESVAGADALRRNGATNVRINEMRVMQLEAFRAGEKLQRHRSTLRTVGMLFAGLIGSTILAMSVTTMPDDPGTIVSLFILANMVLFATQKFSANVAKLPDLVHASRRFLDLMSEQKEQLAFVSSTQTPLKVNRIQFEQVSAAATRLDAIGLLNFNFQINKSESVMIVDECGQSIEAISKLLAGHTSPDSGRISLNSINLTDLDVDQRQQTLGMVPREPYVFQTSLRSNIAPRSNSISIEKLTQIVSACGLSDLVNKLPERLDSVIGRQGIYTTWDERFRIGLARVLNLDPQIVILELPKFGLPTSLCQTINRLINENWQDRIVVVLTSQYVAEIFCRSKHRFNRVGQFLPIQ